MMKSGLGQNEKLKALRIVIDNVNENKLNETLRKVVAFDKQIKDFMGWELVPPDGVDELMEYISEPISVQKLQEHKDKDRSGRWMDPFMDPFLSLRLVAHHVCSRQRRSIMEAIY